MDRMIQGFGILITIKEHVYTATASKAIEKWRGNEVDKMEIDGIKCNMVIDESDGKDMTAKVYYRKLDGVIQILKIEYEEPVGGRGV